MGIPIGQQIERRYIQFALEQAGVDVRSLEFSDARSKVPDAQLKLTDDRRIGIEQTQIRVPGKVGRVMSAREASHRYVMERAEEAYKASCPSPRPLHVDVDFGGADIRLSAVESVAKAVAEVVMRFEHAAENHVHIDHLTLYRAGWLIDREVLFEYVGISYFQQVTQPCWAPSGGGYVPPLTPEIVQARIDAKEGQYERYAADVDEVWLILTMESGSPATHLDLEAVPADHPYPTRFKRVFLDQIVGSEVRELRVCAPSEQTHR